MAKLTVANAIFEMCMEAWRDEGWRVKYHLQPHRRDTGMLATPDTRTRTVKMYPHPTHILPEKTGLHELIHIRFGLSGSKRHEEITYFLEEWVWRRLGKKQKTALHSIFVAPLNERSEQSG